jgi:predicted O-methyltransferase YrrM
MLYPQKKYFQFLLKSSNQHGVHSPFVYQLITKCFYKKIDKSLWGKFLKAQTSKLKKKENSHSKSDKNRVLSYKKTKLLLKIVGYFNPKNMLEIGASSGLKMVLLTNDIENSCVTTLIDATETLSESTQNKEFDCIYFHSNQNQQTILNHFNNCLKSIHNNSLFIFNDMYGNKEATAAWSSLKKHSKVSVSVDLFYFGIIFFRKEQAKEHFKIRVSLFKC